MSAKISVITVTFNAEKVLENTILSLIGQKYSNLEYIVIDGKSTDNTHRIIEKYKQFISIYVSEKDSGIYDAMNKGIARATGDYIYFLNAGDMLLPGVLQTVSNSMNLNDIQFLYGNVQWIGKDIVYDGKFDIDKIAIKNICHQAIFYDRRIFNMLGSYDLKYNVLADYVLNMKCFANQKIKKQYVDIIVANYDAGYSEKAIDRTFNRKEHYKLIKNLFGWQMVIKTFIRAILRRCSII